MPLSLVSLPLRVDLSLVTDVPVIERLVDDMILQLYVGSYYPLAIPAQSFSVVPFLICVFHLRSIS